MYLERLLKSDIHPRASSSPSAGRRVRSTSRLRLESAHRIDPPPCLSRHRSVPIPARQSGTQPRQAKAVPDAWLSPRSDLSPDQVLPHGGFVSLSTTFSGVKTITAARGRSCALSQPQASGIESRTTTKGYAENEATRLKKSHTVHRVGHPRNDAAGPGVR